MFQRRGKMGFPPPLPPPIPLGIKKKYLNSVWGHLVYQPIQRAKGFMIPKMNTLETFLDWAEREGHPQGADRKGKGEHPLSLELVALLVTDFEISVNSRAFQKIKDVLSWAVEGTEPSIKSEVVPFMMWGVESRELTNDNEDELYAEKRISRDGDDFESVDITSQIRAKLYNID
jgi:hypothetical protein